MSLKDFKSLALSILLIFFLAWFFFKPLSNISSFFYNLSGKFAYQLGSEISEGKEEVSSYLDSLEKIKELQLDNKQLKLENIKLKSYVKRHKFLEQGEINQAALVSPSIRAEIIARSPNSWHKQIIISKGAKDGVKLGKGVFTLNGIIGQIEKVNDHNSIVQLIYDNKFKIGAKISRTGEYGVISGAYPESASLEFIKIDSKIQAKDKIVTSGLCLDDDSCPYPSDYPIGEVTEVKKDPNIVGLVVKIDF